MNIEQTKEAIRVMQAYVDGNEVEFKWGSMDWNSTDNGMELECIRLPHQTHRNAPTVDCG